MELNTKTVFIGAFGALAGIAGIAGIVISAQSPVENAPVTAQSGPVEALTQARGNTVADTACVLKKGRVYSWNYLSDDQAVVDAAAMGFPGAAATQTTVKTGIQATLSVKVLRQEDDRALVMARLTDAKSDQIQRGEALERPFLIHIESDCSINGFAHEAMTPQAYGRVQQSVIQDLDFAIPGGQAFESADTFGKTTSELSWSTTQGAQGILKSMTALVPWQVGAGRIAELESGQLRVIRTQGWFDDMQLQVTGTGTGVTSSRSVVVTTKVANDDLFVGLSEDEKDYVWTDLLAVDLPLSDADNRFASAADVRVLEGKKEFSQAFDEFVTRVENDAPIQQVWPDMRNYLEARPEAAAQLVQKLKDAEMPVEARMATYMALGNAHTPEAKEALEGIMTDEGAPVFERVRAILNLIDRPDVGPDLAEYLAKASSSPERSLPEQVFARHSMLALGAMSSRQASKPEVKAVAVRTITSALESETEVVFLGPVYKAMANVGDSSLLPLVQAATTDPDHMIREAAAVVTRRMKPSESSAFTQRWLEKETDWRVKEVIYMTLENQTFTANQTTSRAVLKLAIRDLNAQPTLITRKSIIRLLARAKSEMGPQDELSSEIEVVFLKILPYEVQVRSGLYLTIANEISNPVRLREALASLHAKPVNSNPQTGVPTLGGPTTAKVGVK